MEKKTRFPYAAPKLEITLTDCRDLITTSTALGPDDGTPNYDKDGWA